MNQTQSGRNTNMRSVCVCTLGDEFQEGKRYRREEKEEGEVKLSVKKESLLDILL